MTLQVTSRRPSWLKARPRSAIKSSQTSPTSPACSILSKPLGQTAPGRMIRLLLARCTHLRPTPSCPRTCTATHGYSTGSILARIWRSSARPRTSGPGDEALADAVRRELAEDSATTDLNIVVAVRNGVAHLRGRVSDLDDADNPESVAGRG